MEALNFYRKQLADIENRNIALKTQLVNILQHPHYDRSLLDRLEYFHNLFLQQDTRFEAMRNEIALQYTWMQDTHNRDNIARHQQYLRSKLSILDQETLQLAATFSNYLKEYMPATSYE
jgi:hypothetical protein